MPSTLLVPPRPYIHLRPQLTPTPNLPHSELGDLASSCTPDFHTWAHLPSPHPRAQLPDPQAQPHKVPHVPSSTLSHPCAPRSCPTHSCGHTHKRLPHANSERTFGLKSGPFSGVRRRENKPWRAGRTPRKQAARPQGRELWCNRIA